MIQYFWDAEPKNDEGPGSKIWCLGLEYVTQDKDEFPTGNNNNYPDSAHSTAATAVATTESDQVNNKTTDTDDAANNKQDDNKFTNPEPTTAEVSKTLGWPKAFLDDFESRIWMTYRSNFPPIPKSQNANAGHAMTLSVRLRSQLVEHHQGFTSDTGWGCMIRSGQSLLANALVISRLGRGALCLRCCEIM